jgi:nitrogen fixation protein FixH
VLAFFGIVGAVNAAMVWAAISTYSGGVGEAPYRRGLKYNERIHAAAKQEQAGWHDEAQVDGRGLRLRVLDAGGRPVAGLTVKGVIGRPATNREDIALALREAPGGAYAAVLPSIAPGAWILDLEAAAGAGDDAAIVYRLRKRLWLKP